MTDEAERNELLALLAWWRDAGVETALDDSPVDWTADPSGDPSSRFAWPHTPVALPKDAAMAGSSRLAGSRPASGERGMGMAGPEPADRQPIAPPPVRGAPAASPPRPAPLPRASTPATMAAREAARKARTLTELEAVLRDFDGCPLKATAKNLCFYRGSPRARLMIIGEAPGREEDLEGRPFVGRAGQLLDRMLAAIGLAEKDVHITNVVYWRPPGNRTPTPEEVQICQPFLERQMALVAPEIVLTLGGPAAKAILDVSDGILRVRGKWAEIESEGRRIRVMPTLHPAYLLRTPLAKRQAWRDLLAVMLALDRAAHGEKT